MKATPLTLREAGALLGLDADAVALADRILDAHVSDGRYGSIGFEDGEHPNALAADDVEALAQLVLVAIRRAAAWQNVEVRS